MYLKSLELQGFKSFPDKTKLTFEGGATVIVGPNGSGKSNISDAMRWVLGEISSKSIRGTKMEDIIFGGADSRRPMGFAEVSVTFDNSGLIGRLDCPYDEVTVTRRYYRSGESEYYINRRAVRLRDIYELFMNTGVGRDGYSIIGQGKIAEMISKKSDERRSIFEDASGIAKYRHKKSETERQLANTEDNMTRIRDVFSEVEAQVVPLEKEAEKAKKAIDLLETKKKVDVQLWLYDTEKLRTDVSKCEESFRNAEFDLQNAEDAVKALEVQSDRLFEISQSNQAESENLLAEIRKETDLIHGLDSTYRITETNILHTREMIAAAEGAAVSAQKSAEAETAAALQRAEKISELAEALKDKEARYDALKTDTEKISAEAREYEFKIDRALSDIHALESEMASVKARIEFIDNAQNNDSGKNLSILKEIENYERQSENYRKDSEDIKKTIAGYDASMLESARAADACTSALADLYSKRQDDAEAITAQKLRCDSVRQRIDTFKTMEQQLEGYSGSVRFVMKKYESGEICDRFGVKCGKIYGPLSTLIQVEDKYITAIETALGHNLQHIVVEDESVAKAAMFALKKAEAGRATFFPLSSMKGQGATPEMREAMGYEGYIAVADELVGGEKKFSEILSGLLGRTLIFDTVDHATAMAKALKYRVRAVTLDGQQINVGGSFTGGSVRQKGNILGRSAEIKRLESEEKELLSKIEKDEAELRKLADKISEIEDEKDSAEQKVSLIKLIKDGENTRLDQLLAKLDANDALISRLRSDYGDMERERAQYDEDKKALKVRQTELDVQIKEIGAARADMDVKKNDLLDRKSEGETSMTEALIAINEIKKDIETEEGRVKESEARLEGFMAAKAEQNEKISELEGRIGEYEREKSENRSEYSERSRILDELTEKRTRLEDGNSEFKRKIGEVTQRTREKLQQKELIFKEYTRFENRLTNLRAEQDKLATKLWDDHELTRADASALGYPALTQETRAEAAAKQTECRNKLRVLGNVDLDAVNKYKEIKARYDYMSGQIRDLEASRADLLDVIEKLEGEMKTSFMDSFNQINENFNKTFSELFGGGSAEISLTDPENVLESGIEIKAAPPGKIIKNLVQLSGGEQSFIGIALFFAILQVNPTPFCILDEIEAALDEVNVARLAEYIKRYASGTQFIMITHRRGTMEAANRLYGVTMPERGISKVLELDVNDISKKKGDEWNGIFG